MGASGAADPSRMGTLLIFNSMEPGVKREGLNLESSAPREPPSAAS